ncbi:MAG: hypothetical protein DMF63_09835 [Acidobacteria bacterium]|nr:MAG: hypothetical protein DMF63_09835 [Acidobacteriota bacterium]
MRRALIGLLEIKQFLQTSAGKVSFVNTTMSPEGFVLTGDDGEFEIRHVRAGTYYPFVQVRNVLNPQSVNSFYGNTSSLSVNKLDSFFQKMNVDGMSEVQVLVPVKRGAAISGTVSYADGTPAIGVKVKIFRSGAEIGEDDFVSVGDTETDDRGYYRRVEMVPGTYFVEVNQPSDHGSRNRASEDWRDFARESELKTYFPGIGERKRAEAIQLDWGQEAANTDIKIPERKLYKVSGKVIAKDTQQPLSKIKVTFEREGDDGPEFYGSNDANQITTDMTGSWSFKDLPPGKYRIKISPQKYSYFFDTRTHDDESPYAETYKKLEIVETDTKEFLVELPLESAISGSIRANDDKDALPKSVRLYLVDRDRKVLASKLINVEQPKDEAQTKKMQIDFRIGSLSAGTYLIRAEIEDDENYVKSVRIKGIDALRETFTIKEAEEIKDVTVVVSRDSGTLAGTAYGANEKPAPLTNLLLVPADRDRQKGDDSYFSGWTNSMGEFRIKAAPGDYYVLAGVGKPNSVKSSAEDWFGDAAKNGEKVRIKPNETTKISVTVLSQ